MFRLEGWFSSRVPETMEIWFGLTDQMTVVGVTCTKENHTMSSFPGEQTRISSLERHFMQLPIIQLENSVVDPSPWSHAENLYGPMTCGATKPTLSKPWLPCGATAHDLGAGHSDKFGCKMVLSKARMIYRCICKMTSLCVSHIAINVHTYIHTYMHACIHTYIHACIHTYIHTYIHKYI